MNQILQVIKAITKFKIINFGNFKPTSIQKNLQTFIHKNRKNLNSVLFINKTANSQNINDWGNYKLLKYEFIFILLDFLSSAHLSL